MIGLVGKSNDKGLGILTREWADHLPIDKVFCKVDTRTIQEDRFTYFNDETKIDLTGITALVILETPFQPLLKKCKELCIKTILKVNYEFLPTNLEHEPDIYLCSSSLNYDESPEPKILIPDPVDTDKLKYEERKKAQTFLHVAGTLGVGGANGTQEFLDAIPLVTSDVRFIVRSQKLITIKDSRVDLKVGNVENYWDLYKDGDVFVSPQKFRATSLPIQEAMASGMPVMCTDIKPFNEFVQFTFPYKDVSREWLSRMVNYHTVSPESIAKRIDDIANTDITRESLSARVYAESISWDNLRDKLIELCTK